jgi:hypothetical protein
VGLNLEAGTKEVILFLPMKSISAVLGHDRPAKATELAKRFPFSRNFRDPSVLMMLLKIPTAQQSCYVAY